MGHEIVYCAHCGTRLKSADFAAGTAMALSNRKWCLACIEQLKPSLSPEAQAKLDQVLHAKTTAVQAATPAEPEPEASRFRTPTPVSLRPRKNRLPMILALAGAGALLLVVIIAVAASGGSRPAATPRTLPPPSSASLDSAPDPQLSSAPEPAHPGLEKVRAFARANPDQVDETLRRYGELLWELTERSPLFPKVKEEMAPYERMQKESGARAMAEVARTLEIFTQEGKFKQAYEFLNESRSRRPDPDWSAEITKRLRELDRAVEEAWLKLAEAAQSSGDADKADEILRPSRQWGIDSYTQKGDQIVTQLRERSRGTPPPPPSDSTAGAGGVDVLVLPSQMKPVGSIFESGEVGGRKVWIAKHDPSLAQISNGLDFQVSVKSGVRYNFYFRVYACCAETMRFYVQGDEFRGRTRDGRMVDYAIGNGPAISPGIPAGLPSSHDHAGADARQWAWVRLQKQNPFTSDGLKRIRWLTPKGGIAISHVLATSTRLNPPTDAELQELEKQASGGK